MSEKIKNLLQILPILIINTILNVVIISCVSGMVLIKLMEIGELNRFVCLAISIGVVIITYLHVRYGGGILDRAFEKQNGNPKLKKENEE